METKHTPGTWKAITQHSGVGVVTEETDFGVVWIGHKEQLEGLCYPFNEAIANAKLIAAAPDMLDALQTIIAAFKKVTPPHLWQEHPGLNKCKAAIKKATE